MSWRQLAEIDAFGTSLFQNACCRRVVRFVPEAMFEEKGAEEKHFVVKIPLIGLEGYVYRNSAEIVSSRLNIRFEQANSVTPEDLTMKLIKEVSNAF
jgi:hypothetical protein